MSKYKIYNLTPDGWGYLLQYRDGKIYDGYGNLVNLSFGVGTGKDGPQGQISLLDPDFSIKPIISHSSIYLHPTGR